jgi:hypothetical protein
VVSGSLRTDEQFCRDLGVAQTSLKEGKYLALPLGQQANLTWARSGCHAKTAEQCSRRRGIAMRTQLLQTIKRPARFDHREGLAASTHVFASFVMPTGQLPMPIRAHLVMGRRPWGVVPQ